MRLTKKEKEKTQTNCTFSFFLRYIQKGLFFKKININIMTKKKKSSVVLKKKKK